MKTCAHCGKQLDDESMVCSSCGTPVDPVPEEQEPEESSTAVFGALGFFIPLAGLILYCIWRNDSPRKAKHAGIGALVGFVSGIVLAILLFVFVIVNAI